MQNRSRLVNKLALVLLSIVVLELVLIGDRVQPVKAIKKKIYLKKLKKILPLLALIKPKKKLILVPIPIPMFNKPGQHHPYAYGASHHHHHNLNNNQQQQQHVAASSGPHAMTVDGATPMSFIMEPNLVGALGPATSMQLVPLSMETAGSAPPLTMDGQLAGAGPLTMMMPSMTMTISSNGASATMSAIELSGPTRGANTTGALLGPPRPAGLKWHDQQQQQAFDSFEAEQQSNGLGGEHYYSSPWTSSRQPPPLASPAKLLRGERLRQTRPQEARHPQVEAAQAQQAQQAPFRSKQQQQQQQFAAPMPVIIIRNQWRPSKTPPAQIQQQQLPPPPPPPLQPHKNRRQHERLQQQHLTQQQEQQINQALEYEELVPVGPPQLMPVYQTPNGRLHLTPPTPTSRPASDSTSLQAASDASFASPFEHEHEREREQEARQSSSQSSSQPPSPSSGFHNEKPPPPPPPPPPSDSAETQGGARAQPTSAPPTSGDQDEVQTARPLVVAGSPAQSGRSTLKGKQQQQQQAESKRQKQQPLSGGY